MTAADRHMAHLSKILSQDVTLEQDEPISEKVLRECFNTIAEDRVRIRRTDWRGLRVDAMLWHLPDLQPAGRAALSVHVVNRWRAHRNKNMTADHPKPNQGEEKNDLPLPTVKRIITEAKSQTTPREKTTAPSQNPGLAPISAQRRDWFDRLTDWVAAVVTL